MIRQIQFRIIPPIDTTTVDYVSVDYQSIAGRKEQSLPILASFIEEIDRQVTSEIMSAAQKELEVYPLVPENVMHNDRVIAYVRNMTSPIFGVVAGTLGLTSWVGFLFYAICSMAVSALIFSLVAGGRPTRYFKPAWSIWTAQVVTGISSYMLTWTLFYGLVHGESSSFSSFRESPVETDVYSVRLMTMVSYSQLISARNLGSQSRVRSQAAKIGRHFRPAPVIQGASQRK